MTGDDDPDDRRTYPWADLGGSLPDTALRSHYTTLATLRRGIEPLRDGDLRVLLADDAADTLAYGLGTSSAAAIVAINRGAGDQTLTIPVGEWLADGTTLARRYGVGTASTGSLTVADGAVTVTLPGLSGLLLSSGTLDLAGPGAPGNLRVTAERANTVDLAWNAVDRRGRLPRVREPGLGWRLRPPDRRRR